MTTTHHDELQTTPSQSSQQLELRLFTRKALFITILATSLGFVLVQLDVSIVNVALAQIGRELRTGVTGLQWVVDAYTLLFASLLLFAGTLADRIDVRERIWSVRCGIAGLWTCTHSYCTHRRALHPGYRGGFFGPLLFSIA